MIADYYELGTRRGLLLLRILSLVIAVSVKVHCIQLLPPNAKPTRKGKGVDNSRSDVREAAKVSGSLSCPGGALHIFLVRGSAIGKGIYFPEIGIKNGINFHYFRIRNGTEFQDFGIKYKVGYTFSKNWYKERVCL